MQKTLKHTKMLKQQSKAYQIGLSRARKKISITWEGAARDPEKVAPLAE